ncbi:MULTISPECIES: TonB-dependent receptor plug domain-containing protein [unclassified Brevundimonas]
MALAALATSGLARAQEARAQEVGAQEATTLDDVVVTAQRREQSLQEVPITVSVVTARTLESLAADDMGDISAFVPGLSVSNTSPTQANYSIRGVSTSDFGVGTDPAVRRGSASVCSCQKHSSFSDTFKLTPRRPG